ncbi:glucan endo-1-6-beta-glucosidase B [Penicillium hispanicum]|uniref:glucan endo-1-6-beta-glucosidase B n=1 Tax=Penicillium hispanicum TaxID=1080232 RepID=UPI002540B116|nr:glucan endo-1-6-beta-glucosidase B [Penicillium hispanicum]KAJ5591475.1 glucan endo-1-6-beta-glucosidase B [Penicillium hispanicum]
MQNLSRFTALSALLGLTAAWLPETDKQITSSSGSNLFTKSNGKIRGVNMGSLFVFEPWIGETAWDKMGCNGTRAEFDCVKSLGQDAANTAFAQHWKTWITEDDIKEIASYGLNSIRVPVGYWLREDLVSDTEYFPQGGLEYVQKLCGWASDAGLYIIMDLHGAPGAQVADNPDTGRLVSEPGFYADSQYERALTFLEWMTDLIHNTTEFRHVGMLEIVNEPLQKASQVASMREKYYPDAFSRIRAAESSADIDKSDYVHIQMMDKSWGSGNPTEYLNDTYYAAYDSHRYLKYVSSIPVTHDSYLNASCNYDPTADGETPIIVGEWSLSPPDDVQASADWAPSSNVDFYKKWFAAQVHGYEKAQGWLFWTWRAQLDDYRWSYKDAVSNGVIPTDLNDLESVCS